MQNDVNSIEDLYINTEMLFRKAIELLKFKSDYSDFYDLYPEDYRPALSEYEAGLRILDDLIEENHFCDKESFKLVYNAIRKYEEYISDDYPMTRKLVTKYLNDIYEYGEARFND